MKHKHLYLVLTILLLIVCCMAFVSCGDDEDEITGGPTNEDMSGDSGNGGSGGSAPKDVVAVDLGLPSGTLWATCNIGADSPEQYGDYFAWGETATKSTYSWSTYKWCNYSEYMTGNLTKYCSNGSYGYNGFTDTLMELELDDDAAYVCWGPGWRMPRIEQLLELFNSSYTTTTWTTLNGVYGRKITSKMSGFEGNYIVLPAAGYRSGSSLYDAGSNGNYWSRSLYVSDTEYAWLYFESSDINTYPHHYRSYGNSVRPVRSSE